ncbi:glycosyltransferase family 4 protein [Moorena bouillonii]|uniref:Glycosyltransferase n=1 Tax=Moorena bouillonii PNG TaxID=568701 RepID=A0A1U7N5K9_9CYAN|nr:glycosyltransferase family 4 protein [Moorena bouillonii]OLT61237.1 glycosyltransferase [Moorena bouillonii PNG]
MSEAFASWICCQIGAREHYAIPRSLHQQGNLSHLITDAWITPQSPLNYLPKNLLTSLRDRFHPDLGQASTHAFTNSLIQLEIQQRLQKVRGWEQIIARNHWFQQNAVNYLAKIAPKFNKPPILFTYSYAALDILQFAKAQGWRTVLGQIDPGIVEEKIVAQAHRQYPHYQSTWQPAPPDYWTNWQKECHLADRIVVNSTWSSQALQQVGVPSEKIAVIPLAYQAPTASQGFVRTYPEHFSPQRPLRVLFLGQVILRKGIFPLLEAARLLQNEPIEFQIVGSLGITLTPAQQNLPNVRWIGSVPRSATSQYYQQADVFLFPTLSDGFGLTQLEAQAWKLPLIVSRFCGEVVKDQENGLILPEVSGEAISQTLQWCLNHPQQLQYFAQNSTNLSQFSLSQLQQNLQHIGFVSGL